MREKLKCEFCKDEPWLQLPGHVGVCMSCVCRIITEEVIKKRVNEAVVAQMHKMLGEQIARMERDKVVREVRV